MLVLPIVAITIFVLATILLMAVVKILREYERAVVFTFGRFQAIGAERNSTVIFPMPLDIVTPLLKLLQVAAEEPHVEPGAGKPADRAGPPIQ